MIVGTEAGYWYAQDLLKAMGFRPENGAIQVGDARWIHSNTANGQVVIQEKVKFETVKKGDNSYLIVTSFDVPYSSSALCPFP
ncbi:hypothetical protein CAPN009_12000 [Capnocytophaga canimorsus]|nr:hypothetical protein CAPN009_12000 [Capnocytophaga canimorsus]